MQRRPLWSRVLLHVAIALVAGILLGSIIQTQINLAALARMGVEISLARRIATTLWDLVTFSPIYALLFSVGFLISQTVALTISRLVLHGRYRLALCPLLAIVALFATLHIVNHFAPMPTLVAATRTTFGLVAMLASAGFAGLLLALLRGRGHRHRGTHLTGAAIMALGAGIVGLAPSPPALAQVDAPAYRLEVLTEGLEHPWSLAFLPEGRMLVTERPGRLWLLDAQGQRLDEIEGVPEVFASGQAGLFDVLVSPQDDQHDRLFLSYACGELAANHTCLARARLDDGALSEVEEIFRTHPAKRGAAHYGGRLAWLGDGTLLLTLGDGFDYREQAQNLESHLGSLVRLNTDGSAAQDNPFVNEVDARPEIYSIGHRNVQGLVVAGDGRVIAHEHGPRGGDEINLISPGANYGWPIATTGLDYTGARVTPFTEYPGTEAPLLEWTPSIAPSGMTLYDGDLFPAWRGNLFVGSLVDHEVRRVTLDADATRAKDVEGLFGELEERIRDVRTGPDGAVYLLTDSPDGQLVRVVPASP
ncbi:PQQ-dependent sugar dehydrogenase [Vreelandella malpeensis]|uniref:PQQ-dependent sugar dehydrogenase n=1 Tax=Vreelandella malpeensis TaxID=1172368 RepID=A0ABS8DQV8_9GAMM|nr:PQQ-dependent sugar dehydrogenase [Halomonas malpeensis]MCB8888697.1 PQQ-dependent sugar dehydrogenase [Halomonas malpeensis]